MIYIHIWLLIRFAEKTSWKYSWLICCERKTLFICWKSTADHVNFADRSQSIQHEHKTINKHKEEKMYMFEMILYWSYAIASCGFCGVMDNKQAAHHFLLCCVTHFLYVLGISKLKRSIVCKLSLWMHALIHACRNETQHSFSVVPVLTPRFHFRDAQKSLNCVYTH
jgi:hypothetical protein